MGREALKAAAHDLIVRQLHFDSEVQELSQAADAYPALNQAHVTYTAEASPENILKLLAELSELREQLGIAHEEISASQEALRAAREELAFINAIAKGPEILADLRERMQQAVELLDGMTVGRIDSVRSQK